MAVELIKQGVKLQEETEDGEGEEEEEEEERQQKALICYEKAKSYLTACLNHAKKNCSLFDETFLTTIHYNLACVYQKVPDLLNCSIHLDEAIKLLEPVPTMNSLIDQNKTRLLTKFQLQQCAVKSQLENHPVALEHGKLSVKN